MLTRSIWCALLVLGTALPAGAQGGPTVTLSLDEAISLAKQNNPLFLQSVNARRRSEASLRAAYGAFIPTANTNFNLGYRQGKPQYFAGVAFGSNSDIISSSWGLNLNLNLSAATLANMRRSRLQLDAAETDLTSQDQTLRANVIQEYLFVLQQQSQANLQDTLVAYNQLQLDLAKAKAGVGSATSLDVKRAEVALGQQQVAALKAHNAASVEVLRLYQLLGVPAQPNTKLTSDLPITEPKLDVNQLLSMARSGNPALRSLESREQATEQSVRASRGQYLPSLGLNASIGGSAQQYTDANYLVTQAQGQTASSRAACFSTDSLRRGAGMPGIGSVCNSMVFTDAQAAAIRSSNSNVPFRFTSQPYNLSVGFSLPLFDGFNRELNVQQATADRSDARYNVRAQELKLAADVTAGYTTLMADYQTARLLEQNSAAAREALQLAQERYRVGLNSLVDLQQARGDYEKAETDRISAIFEFHRAYAALESAVGRPLR